MKISALEIRKQEFSKAFRGFEVDEVQSFLQMIAGQWQDSLDEQERLKSKIRELEMKLTHYVHVEEALQEALQTARESSRQTIEAAEKKAAAILAEAETRAVEITRGAEEERHQIKRETAKISGRRKEIIARLRAFLMSEMELLAHFDGEDPVGFIKLLPAEQQRDGQQRARQLLQNNTADLFEGTPKEEVEEETPEPDVISDSELNQLVEATFQEAIAGADSPDNPPSTTSTKVPTPPRPATQVPPKVPISEPAAPAVEFSAATFDGLEEFVASAADIEALDRQPKAPIYEPTPKPALPIPEPVANKAEPASPARPPAEDSTQNEAPSATEPSPMFVPRPRWRRKSLVAPTDEFTPPNPNESKSVAASSEEIDKIGRLLDDLDA